jgi:hypothetical protein
MKTAAIYTASIMLLSAFARASPIESSTPAEDDSINTQVDQTLDTNAEDMCTGK